MTKDNEFSWAIVTLASLPVMLIAEAFIFAAAWAWFVMPLGLPRIGAAQASGLMLCTLMFRDVHRPKDDGRSLRERFWEMVSNRVAVYAVVGGFGYLLHRLMVA